MLLIVEGRTRCAGAVLAFELQPGRRPAALTLGGARFDEDTAQLGRERRALVGLQVGDHDLGALGGQHAGCSFAQA